MAHLVVEGQTDEVVLRRILTHLLVDAGRAFGLRGRPHLLINLPRYNAAAQFEAFVALVDFDAEPNCVGAFVNGHLPNPSLLMRFRVAVRAIEAWLMADREGLAEFLSVSSSRIPLYPDAIQSPKTEMVNIARHSRRKLIRTGMVPREGSGTAIGPAYASILIEFANTHWDIHTATTNSPSLSRSMVAISSLAI